MKFAFFLVALAAILVWKSGWKTPSIKTDGLSKKISDALPDFRSWPLQTILIVAIVFFGLIGLVNTYPLYFGKAWGWYLALYWAWEAVIFLLFVALIFWAIKKYSKKKKNEGGHDDSHAKPASEHGGGQGDHEHHQPAETKTFSAARRDLLGWMVLAVIIGLAVYYWPSDGCNQKPDSAGNPTVPATEMSLTTPVTQNLASFSQTGFRIVANHEIRYSIPGVPGSFLYRPGDENETTTTPAARVKSLADMNYHFWDPRDPLNGKVTFKLIP
jgi:hypothetical protein